MGRCAADHPLFGHGRVGHWFCGFFANIGRDTANATAGRSRTLLPTRLPPAAVLRDGGQRLAAAEHAGRVPLPAGNFAADRGRPMKMRWILTNCPEQHRPDLRSRAATPQETAARLTAVRQYAAQIAPKQVPQVLATSISDNGCAGRSGRDDWSQIHGDDARAAAPAPTGGSGGTAAPRAARIRQRRLPVLLLRLADSPNSPDRQFRLQVPSRQGRSLQRSHPWGRVPGLGFSGVG